MSQRVFIMPDRTEIKLSGDHPDLKLGDVVLLSLVLQTTAYDEEVAFVRTIGTHATVIPLNELVEEVQKRNDSA